MLAKWFLHIVQIIIMMSRMVIIDIINIMMCGSFPSI